jgi:glycosyltransferase involved in cell wall biosynthesis
LPAEVRTHVLGPVAHAALPELYSLADLFVFPSATDTFGMAVLEAQACGLPALVTDAGGPKEIIRDGATGWVLPGDDLPAWAGKILEIAAWVARAPGEYAALRRAAREHIVAHYTWSRFMEAMFQPAEPVAQPGVPVPHARAAPRNGAAARPSAQLALY